MIIGFDGKRAISNQTGLGNYSRAVIRVLADNFPENRFLLYTPSYKSPIQPEFLQNPSIEVKTVAERFFKSWWRSFGIVYDLKKDRVAVYHGLSNELPFGIADKGIKSVVTIHDLIFLRFPRYYNPIDRQIYRIKFNYACKKADQIIAISEQTKQDIVDFFDIPAEKIEVIYQPCDPVFKTRATEEQKNNLRRKYSLPSEFILYIGTVEERKNLLTLIKALKELPEPIPLVVIGRETAYAAEIKRYIKTHDLSRQVIWAGQVPFSDLPLFYQTAALFIYPSLFEGFGLPVLEALSSGVPVITSTGSCFREAGGDAAVYVDPLDAKAMSGEIIRLLNDPSLRELHIQKGYAYIRQFEPEAIASRMMTLYRSLV